jgi:peroxiredoxin
MRLLFIGGALVMAAAVTGFRSEAPAEPGQPAPAFALTDTNGKSHSLAEYKGKYVVLEWLNYGCPYVQTHYESGNMPQLQKDWTKKGVVWLSVVSSKPGKQGHFEPSAMNAETKKMGGNGTAVLYDTSGEIGKAYGARTTPHMFVIDPKGTLIYAGGIDNKAVSKPQEDPSVTNYVSQALNESMAGKEVSVKTARPYGCGVKY